MRKEAALPVIVAHRLSKRYGVTPALAEVDLRVAAGEVYGFIGRNGAGKTTTIRLLLGMLQPSGGEVSVLGTRVVNGRGPDWRRVGYLVEAATAWPDLTVRENLRIAALLYGVRGTAAADRAIEQFALAPFADRRAGVLSTGNLQRLALARALFHEPELVILDEPTTGLDPAGVVEVRELIGALARDRGATVFLSSHILTEIERAATRIGVVHRGRLVAEFDAAELGRRRRQRLEVTVRDPALGASILRGAGFLVPDDAGDAGPVLELADERALQAPDEVARVLVEGGAPPLRLVTASDDIERVFLELTMDTP